MEITGKLIKHHALKTYKAVEEQLHHSFMELNAREPRFHAAAACPVGKPG
jgi:hypothetical protein